MGNFGKSQTEKLLSLVKETTKNRNYKLEDSYILDDENLIAVVYNPERRKVQDPIYVMIHYRFSEQGLVELNRWNQPSYFFGVSKKNCVLENLGYFLVQGNSHTCVYEAIYDYKNARFIIEKGLFDCLGFDNTVANASNVGKNYLEEYSCFLARFTVSSLVDQGDVISYTNPITNDLIQHSFAPAPETYYALINLDGTIRGNRLFMGDSFSKISRIVRLRTYSNGSLEPLIDIYSSLRCFKEKRISALTEVKNQNKMEYRDKLEERSCDSISPYLDGEIAKVISLSK